MGRMLKMNSKIDLDRHDIPIMPVHEITDGVAGYWSQTEKLAFTGVTANIQLAIHTGTDRTGWIVSFTASQDCWIKFETDGAPTAASDTANNIFLAKGAILGPIDMGPFTYVAAIRDATTAANGTLNIIYHAHPQT